MTGCHFSTGRISENSPHGFGGSGEEVSAIVEAILIGRSHESQPRFMHQRCGLQSVPWLFLGKFRCRELSQLVIDQGKELLGGGEVAGFDLGEDAGDVGHRQTDEW